MVFAERIGGYDLVEELGAGAMGSVYLGRKDGERVAIKIIHERLQASGDLMDRFVREARAGRRVRHPNVVRTYEAGSESIDGKTRHYLVMEYVEGKDLRELLDDLEDVPEALLREIARQTAAGLEAIHAAGVIHRDLKPENVLITEANEIRIMDLGVAKLLDATVALTREGQFTGTVLYASPEQFHDEEVGASSDLYALGVLLYELATGRNPFFRRDPVAVIQAHLEHVPPPANDVNPDLSPFLAEVMRTLLAKKVEDRIETAAELRMVFDEAESSRWWAQREPELLRQKHRLPRIPVQRQAALHGREAELERLQAVWNGAARGRGALVLVEGEAGIGKSRLLDALLEHVGGEKAHVLYGAFTVAGGLTGLTDALVAYLGTSDLEEVLRPHLAPFAELLPAFAARLKGETPPDGVPTLDAEGLTTLTCRLVKSLASEKPLLWLVDDLHLARDEGRELLAAVAQATKESPVLLVATSHPGAVPEEEREGVETLELGRLGARDVVDLLTDVLQNDLLAERLSGKIAAASDGVPLFVFELLRSLGESGSLEKQPDGTWTQARPFTEVEVPPNVRELMVARLAGLADEDRELLDVAAVQGHVFDAGLVAAVLEEKRVHVLRRLAVVERRTGMVRARGGRYVFDQRQLQETLHAEVPPELAAEYHALLAEAFEARIDGEPDGSEAHFLARHHLQGSRPGAGLQHLDRALDHLERAVLNDEFLDLARLALGRQGVLQGRSRAATLLRLGERLSLVAGIGEVEGPLAEAMRLVETLDDPGLGARILYLHARLLLMQGDLDGARDGLEQVKQKARDAGDVEFEARATGICGVILDNTGQHEAALQPLRHHLDVVRALPDPKSEMIAACNLGLALRNLQRFSEARALLERHLELARTFHDLRGEAVACGNLALVASDEGDEERARELALRNIELARRTGSRHSEAAASGNLGLEHLHAGHLEEAWAWFGREHVLAQELGDVRGLVRAERHRGAILQRLGRPDLAIESREHALRLYRDLGRTRDAVQTTYHLAWSLWDAGRKADARRLLGEALQEAREQGFDNLVATLLFGLARATDDEAEVRRLAGEALALAPDNVWLRLQFLALGALPDGDAHAAVGALPVERSAFQEMERHYLLWKATGDADALAEAKRRLELLAQAAPPAFRATVLDGLPLYREIASA